MISFDIFPDSIKYLQVFSIGYQPEQLVLDQLDFHNGIASVILGQKDVELQDIKINATRERNKSADLSTLDLHLRPLNSAQDIIHIVSGLFIGQHAGGGKAEQIFLRGFDIDHGTDINITADGLPEYSSAQYIFQSHYNYSFQLHLELSLMPFFLQ